MIMKIEDILKSIDWEREKENCRVRFNFREMIEKSSDYKERNRAIRYLYNHFTPIILEKNNKAYVDVIDDIYLFNPTPIEYSTYCCIKSTPFITMYPQYPFKGYFMDFANPCLKINIELDGKEFHDAAKDAVRDREIINNGWKVFRIPGYKCYKEVIFENIDIVEDRILDLYYCDTIEGIIESISKLYFDKKYDSCCDKKHHHILKSIEMHLQ